MEKRHLIYIENIIKRHFQNCGNVKDDLIQEGYIAFLKCQKNYDEKKGSIYAYAKKPIINALTKYLNKINFYNENECSYYEKPFEDSDVQFIDLIPDNKQVIEDVEFQITVKNVILQFNNKMQKIIRKFIVGFSQKEISKELHISRKHVNHTIKRFREELKLALM